MQLEDHACISISKHMTALNSNEVWEFEEAASSSL